MERRAEPGQWRIGPRTLAEATIVHGAASHDALARSAEILKIELYTLGERGRAAAGIVENEHANRASLAIAARLELERLRPEHLAP